MRSFPTLHDVTGLARSAFPRRTPRDLARLTRGSSKGVYRLTFTDGTTCLVYRWHPDENFWPSLTIFDLGPFEGRGSITGFLRRHELLTGLAVRVPEIFELDRDAQIALVEDVPGGTLETLLARDAAAGREVLGRLADTLRVMHGHTSAEFGFPGHTAAEFVVERGRRALAEAAARVPLIAARQQALADTLSSRFAAIGPRQRYGVIHEELGPDHVLVDDAGRPVLIDIDGTMVFDIEWEHAFLELRFGPLYPMLRTLPLDDARMRLCRLTHHLSLVAGPLLLIDGDFPRPDSMREIAEANIPRVLASLD